MIIVSKPRMSALLAAIFLLCLTPHANALDPAKSLTQFARTTWTEEHGLPQDTIRAIAQTSDGYLWLGTDEGLARFDGYEFTLFNKRNGDLPADSITALAAAAGSVLWIGTSNGLTRYQGRQFQTFTAADGLPDSAINDLTVDHAGTLWVVAGASLCRFHDGRFTTYAPGKEIPTTAVRRVYEDRHHVLWIAGLTEVFKMEDGKFVTVVGEDAFQRDFATFLQDDRHGNLWIGASSGLLRRSRDGKLRAYGLRDGMPDAFIRAIAEDRDGNLWIGTNAGVARLEGDRFVAFQGNDRDRGLVRCLFEDREGNLWLGANSGLRRFRDTRFVNYGTSEGLPGDDPNAVFQDRAGQIWVGFHNSGLMRFSEEGLRVYTTRDGLPYDEIFSIREARNGDLLIGSRGFVRMRDGRFTTYIPPDPLARFNVFDVLEDSTGRIWLATPGGLAELRGDQFRIVAPGGPILASAVVTLCEGRDGAIWAGTYGKGLWRVQGDEVRLFTVADGLSSDQIHTLYSDPDGVVWIGTFGGGLNSFRDGKFTHFGAKDGLRSDNIAKITDDGDSLWLSTTRGICRIAKQQLREFAAHRRKHLEPVNFGVEDGLRSAQAAPSYPIGAGGTRTSDGMLLFTTSRGLAVYSSTDHRQPQLAPAVHLVELSVDGQPIDLASSQWLGPHSERIQIRYGAIHLSAPEQVRYSYKLAPFDNQWVRAGSRRIINYDTLRPGHYEFAVRAEIPGGPVAERSFPFEVLPGFYETWWFRLFAALMVGAAAWGIYQFRLRQIRYGFSLVLEERARLAREIHDTLAQGFVGISSQLDAVAMCMPEETTPARKYLDLARRMARHSLTEARRSVMDLRASALEGQNLAAALESGARTWTAGFPVDVDVEVTGARTPLPPEMEQHLLRIAQEAVTNVVKHAGASRVSIKLHTEAGKLFLQIKDNGRGFEPDGVFSTSGGHFGVLGMRERAERLGGEFRVESRPEEGTEVEVKVPLP